MDLSNIPPPTVAAPPSLESISNHPRLEDLLSHQQLITIPAINWVPTGKIGPVKDQGNCLSCWAFAGVGALESIVAIK